jgi:hypothetical protein
MLEWKPRLILLALGAAALAANFGLTFFSPGNFGWGVW